MNDYPETIPCVRCGRPLKDWGAGDNQPVGGLEFAAAGHYPSSIHDDGSGDLVVNICDSCLLAAAGAGRVLKRTYPEPRERGALAIWGHVERAVAVKRRKNYRKDAFGKLELRWLDQPLDRPRGRRNPRENPFCIDYFSPSMSGIELVRYYTPFERREWRRWKALWRFQILIGHHRSGRRRRLTEARDRR